MASLVSFRTKISELATDDVRVFHFSCYFSSLIEEPITIANISSRLKSILQHLFCRFLAAKVDDETLPWTAQFSQSSNHRFYVIGFVISTEL